MSISARLSNFLTGGGLGMPAAAQARYERSGAARGTGRKPAGTHTGDLQRQPQPGGLVARPAHRELMRWDGHIFGHGQGPRGHEPEQISPWVARIR